MDFSARHIGPSPAEQQQMLAAVGYSSLDALTAAALPPALAGTGAAPLDLPGLPGPLSEAEAQARAAPAGRPEHGGDVHDRAGLLPDHHPGRDPPQRAGEPRLVHGLHALPAGDLAGAAGGPAELPDDGRRPDRAAGGGRVPAGRGDRRRRGDDPRARAAGKGSIFLADADCLPQTLAVLATRAEPLGIELVVAPLTPELVAAQPDGELFGVLLAYPAASGEITDPRPVIAAASARGAAVAVAADLLALTLLTPPGELGADIAIGTTQRFGVPMGFGGPHAAYIAVREGLRRQLPGRLVGVSVDADGHPAYRLALQAREQHIRREKATSNICTAQVLLAVIAGMYAAYHGPDGLAAIARRVHGRAAALAATLRAQGATVDSAAFFDTVAVHGLPGGAATAVERARQAGYNVYLAGPETVQIACDETTTDDHLREVAGRAGRPPGRGGEPGRGPGGAPGGPAADLALPHPPGVPRAPQRDGHAPVPAPAGRLRHRPGPVDDPAGLVHDEAERGGGDGGHHLARVRQPAPLRPAGAGPRLRRAHRRPGSPGWPRSPVTTRCRCSRTPGHRGNWPACWRSATITATAATPAATCA